ncbi:MAG TPA: protein kinase [Steroidobacteraceae bacterium]|nr:protein kinase [Steroidobacteraceae bacterium]
MIAQTDPSAALAARVANPAAVVEWLEALASGNCDQSTFLGRVDELLRGSADAAWEVLALLDQYYRRGKINRVQFHALKLHVQRLALGAREDVDVFHSPSTSEPLRAAHTTVPVGAEIARNAIADRVATAPDARAATPRAARPAAASMPAVGDVLRGRYRIIGVLGQGGMGTVFEAVDLDRIDLPQASKNVAVKVLHTEVTQRPQLLLELRSEFQHLQALSHPNIVRVHEFDRDGDTAFFTMELLRGSSLGQLLATREGGVLDRTQTIGVIHDVGAALAHAHSRGIVHGDINPQNIFITRDGEVRVLDFGASHKLKRDPSVAEGESQRPLAVATPRYASCQVLEGEVAEARDDVFGFACIIYLLLTGSHPFQGRPALEARNLHLTPQRPPGLTGRQWHVLQQGLCFERELRPGEVRDWLAQLRLETPGSSSARGSELPPARSARRKWVIAVASVIAAAGIVFAGRWLTRTGEATLASVSAPAAIEPRPSEAATQTVAPSEAASAATPETEAQSAAPPAALPAAQSAAPAAAPAAAPPAAPPAAPAAAPPAVQLAAQVAAPPAAQPAAPISVAAAVPADADATVPAVQAPPPAAARATHARVELSAAVVEVPATEAFAFVPVRRRGSMRGEASFKWWTESGTAKSGADFAPIDAHVEHIANRKSTINLMIPIVSDPTRHEPRSFYVLIDAADPGTAIIARTTTMVTIEQ